MNEDLHKSYLYWQTVDWKPKQTYEEWLESTVLDLRKSLQNRRDEIMELQYAIYTKSESNDDCHALQGSRLDPKKPLDALIIEAIERNMERDKCEVRR